MAISDQMEMALNGQAPQVDPVSGNEVPPGSLPVEVRDDIDAKLSEGEYVVPADVVRFFGVKFFEDLRTKAKIGLAKMEDDGRIGGEPVDMAAMPPQGMDISEEDIAALEQALTTGVYEGGLMDKMAIAAKNDPMVNSRMNAKGMAVGFAAGGLTESLYNDPTRMDSIIEKVMVAANANPALMQELSKRGVAVNTTQANMNPTDIKQANTDTVSEELLEEKSTGFAAGGFNPANYGLGFSTFGPTAPGMGGGETTMVSYYNPTTNATMQIAHNANGPITAVPAGFILGSAPVVTNASMGTGGVGPAGDRFGGAAIGESYTKPNGETATRMPDSFYASGGDQDQERAMKEMMTESDPNDYKSDFTWNDPKVLYQETLDRLNKKPGFLGSMLGAVAPGRIYNATRLKDEKLAIEYLKKHGGDTEEKIATLQDLWDKKATRALGSTEGGPWTGAIMDGWQRGLVTLDEEYGDTPFAGAKFVRALGLTDTPGKVTKGGEIAASKVAEKSSNDQVAAYKAASEGGGSGGDNTAGSGTGRGFIDRSTASSGSSKSSSGGGGNSTNPRTKSKNYDSAGRYTGPMNKGGLMTNKKTKKK